jgi:hypothetical protein
MRSLGSKLDLGSHRLKSLARILVMFQDPPHFRGACNMISSSFLAAAQIKKYDDHSYSKVSYYEHDPTLVRITPPAKKLHPGLIS